MPFEETQRKKNITFSLPMDFQLFFSSGGPAKARENSESTPQAYQHEQLHYPAKAGLTFAIFFLHFV